VVLTSGPRTAKHPRAVINPWFEREETIAMNDKEQTLNLVSYPAYWLGMAAAFAACLRLMHHIV